MPRLPRLDVGGVAQHVVQRGNDRQPCFFTDVDRGRYLLELLELSRRWGCAIHAYVLMTNHVHLLATPRERGSVGRLMQALGRRYVRYVNDHHCRTGTLWEGRYKACLVASDEHLLRCYRYIELNPVRAGMVATPGEYRWSSHAANAHGAADALVVPHELYLGLGRTPVERRAAYRELVAETIPAQETDAIRLNLQRQHAFGSRRFQAAIEAQLQRRAGPAKIGRPRKAESAL